MEELKVQEINAETPAEAKPDLKLVEDATKEVKDPEPVKADKVAKIVAKVKTQEKNLTTKERALADREAKLKGYENIKDMLATDPLAAIESLGINKDKLYESIIKSGEVPTLDDKVAKLEEQLKLEREERLKEKQILEEQRAELSIRQFKSEISTYVKQNELDSLKYTAALGQSSAIFNVINQNFLDTGEVMSMDDAGKLVENYFKEQVDKEYEKLKAIKEKFEPKKVKEPEIVERPSYLSPKTLTNKSTTIPVAESNKFLSNEESKKLLAKKYANKLFI